MAEKKDSTGERLIDVDVEDVLVFDNIDIEAEASKHTAYDLIGEVAMTEGTLTQSIVADGKRPWG